MNFKRLLFIFLSAVSPATSLKMKLWHGVPKKTNGTALVACIDEMHAAWSGKGHANHWNGDGWECGGATWQFSQKFTRGRLRPTAVIAKCTDELLKSAERGEAWVKCKVTRTLAQAWLGWSPRGFKMCDNAGGAPCQLDDGVLLKADGGAACRAEGYCYGGPEAPKEASVSTQTVERTVTVPGGTGDQPSPTGNPASERAGSISSPGKPDAPTDSTTTTQAESFTSVISLPVVVGPGPPTTSTSYPTTPPQPSSPYPSIDAKPSPPLSSVSPPPTPSSPPSTTSSSSSSVPTETVIFITMTSGQTPTVTPPTTPPTFPPPTTRRPIMSTTIDGTLYTYLKEETTTTTPPVPITTTIDKQVLTLIPATTYSTPHTSTSWGRHKTWSRTG